MRLIATSSAFLLLAASYAHAADPVRTVVKTPTWDGAYIGASLGGAFGDARLNSIVGYNVAGVEASGNGVIGGIQSGANVQSGSLVYGIETDLSFTNWSASKAIASVATVKSDVQGLLTFRGRAGYAFDSTLLYATGGIAFANIKQSVTIPGEGTGYVTKTAIGYALGGGIEQMLSSNWSMKAEYVFSGFQRDYEEGNVRNRLGVARVGLNMRF